MRKNWARLWLIAGCLGSQTAVGCSGDAGHEWHQVTVGTSPTALGYCEPCSSDADCASQGICTSFDGDKLCAARSVYTTKCCRPDGDQTLCTYYYPETPSCSQGLLECGLFCVDTLSDQRNCGECGRACAGGEACVAGNCTSNCGELTLCGSSCVDVNTDPFDCGECGNSCAIDVGQGVRVGTCSGGRCDEPSSGSGGAPSAPPICEPFNLQTSVGLGCAEKPEICCSHDFQREVTELQAANCQVTLDSHLLRASEASGFTFAGSVLTFHGSACDAILTSSPSIRLDVRCPCP